MILSLEIKRKDGENLKQYKVRLYRNKDIYGLTNVEIGELINKETGDNWDESAYRKWATSYIEGWDDCLQAGIKDCQLIQDLEDKQDALYKQQVKTRDKLREMRKHLRDEARIENLLDVFVECADRIAKEKPLEITIKQPNNGSRVGVLQLSDFHFSEIINNFLNTYNHDIFDQRIGQVVSDTIKYCKLMDVGTLKILNQGDLANGNIHVSTRVNSEEDIVYQTMYVAEALSNMMVEFAKHFSLVEFHTVLDNHSRINKDKKEHIEKESFGRFVPWYMKSRLSQIHNIQIVSNHINGVEEFDVGVFDIFHEKAFFEHGHNGRLNTTVADLTLMTKIFPIAIFTSHYHKNFEDEVHGIDLIMNPSGVGTNDYAKSIRKSSKARQKLTIFENNDGSVERVSTFFINLK